MIDVEGIFKLDGANEQRFRDLTEQSIRQGLIADESEALRTVADIAKGKQGLSINEQLGLNTDFGVEVLLETWFDEIGRALNNKVYDITFKVLQVVNSEKKINENTIPTTKVVALIKIKNDENTFYEWSDYGTDVIIGSIKGEGNIHKRKLQHVIKDKVYHIQACSKGPENRYPYFDLDERCTNAKEVSHSFPTFKSVAEKVYGNPIPITETPDYVTPDNSFERQLVKGKVISIKWPRQGSKSVTLNLADSSVNIDDISKDGFGAYLRMVTDVETMTAQDFGRGSYVYAITKINRNRPREGENQPREGGNQEERGGLKVVAFYPELIYPLYAVREESSPVQGHSTNAGDINRMLDSSGKGVPQVAFPSSIPQPRTVPTPAPTPAPSTPAPSTPAPSIDVEARMAECDDFGNPDMDFGNPDMSNPGCLDCMSNHRDTFIDCQKYSKMKG